MKTRSRLLFSLALSALTAFGLGACGTDGGPGGQTGDPIVGQQDLQQGRLALSEAAIRGVVTDGGLTVTLPVGVLDGQAAAGNATVKVTTLEGEVRGQGSASFSLGATGGPVDVPVNGVTLDAPGAPEAGLLVHYKVVSEKNTVEGFRSLLHVLPKVDVQARLPSQLQVGAAAQVRVLTRDPMSGAALPDTDVRLVSNARGTLKMRLTVSYAE